LDLSFCVITDKGLDILKQAPIQKLNLAMCLGVTLDGVSNLVKGLSKLITLDLFGTKIKDDSVSSIVDYCPTLRKLRAPGGCPEVFSGSSKHRLRMTCKSTKPQMGQMFMSVSSPDTSAWGSARQFPLFEVQKVSSAGQSENFNMIIYSEHELANFSPVFDQSGKNIQTYGNNVAFKIEKSNFSMMAVNFRVFNGNNTPVLNMPTVNPQTRTAAAKIDILGRELSIDINFAGTFKINVYDLKDREKMYGTASRNMGHFESTLDIQVEPGVSLSMMTVLTAVFYLLTV